MNGGRTKAGQRNKDLEKGQKGGWAHQKTTRRFGEIRKIPTVGSRSPCRRKWLKRFWKLMHKICMGTR